MLLLHILLKGTAFVCEFLIKQNSLDLVKKMLGSVSRPHPAVLEVWIYICSHFL